MRIAKENQNRFIQETQSIREMLTIDLTDDQHYTTTLTPVSQTVFAVIDGNETRYPEDGFGNINNQHFETVISYPYFDVDLKTLAECLSRNQFSQADFHHLVTMTRVINARTKTVALNNYDRGNTRTIVLTVDISTPRPSITNIAFVTGPNYNRYVDTKRGIKPRTNAGRKDKEKLFTAANFTNRQERLKAENENIKGIIISNNPIESLVALTRLAISNYLHDKRTAGISFNCSNSPGIKIHSPIMNYPDNINLLLLTLEHRLGFNEQLNHIINPIVNELNGKYRRKHKRNTPPMNTTYHPNMN